MALASLLPGRMRSLTRFLLWLTLAVAGATVACTHEPDPVGATIDAAPPRDGATSSDAGPDPGGPDAGRDAGVDAGIDAGYDAGTDAGYDAGTDAMP